ncbi:uncharacterized protein RSE6_06292 [Rhynchosporium secalis]|uniref:F-box domain-containing protein n=1 Tax=Rhynchosporium secalis TaxID=38038 RepID=A0A1E1MA20_RHYSE|nr:uncharacterized protein RSE6_06292 [Rhynchosporium secalis]
MAAFIESHDDRSSIPPRSLSASHGRLHHPPASESLAPRSSIGTLDALPLEILQMAFGILDLQALTDIRALSWRVRALVDGLPPYKSILEHCPDVLRALLSTNMAIHHTAQDIFDALCKQTCAECDQCGPFLDMFTARRYCITCAGNSDDTLCITRSSARKILGLDMKMARSLPTLISIPGQYSDGEKMFRKRILLVRVEAARSARGKQSTLGSATTNGSSEHDSTSSPPLPSPSSTADATLPGYDGHKENPYRYMSMLRFPFFDRGTKSLDWGAFCQACRLGPREGNRGYCDWNILYSTSGYLKHFEQCQMSHIARELIPGCISFHNGAGEGSESRLLSLISNFGL